MRGKGWGGRRGKIRQGERRVGNGQQDWGNGNTTFKGEAFTHTTSADPTFFSYLLGPLDGKLALSQLILQQLRLMHSTAVRGFEHGCGGRGGGGGGGEAGGEEEEEEEEEERRRRRRRRKRRTRTLKQPPPVS
eukprot:763528-Hanusia_phi.AAC.2